MSKANEMFLEIQSELLEIENQVIEGELSNLDALIKMRNARTQADKINEIVKTFEDNRINEIANEASQYPEGYCGFEIKMVNGKELYSFKNIPQIVQLDNDKKALEDKFKTAFKGIVKGVVQTTEEDGVKYWIDENSEMQPIPELNIGKSYLLVKQKR
jgi:hypothetical protein